MDLGTKKAIERRAWEVLKDAGLTKPPVKIDEVIGHLKLHIDYYSLEDPGFIKWLNHKFNINANKVIKAVKDSRLVAAWYPECSRILLDNTLPPLKQTFPKYHEVIHSILPWHKEFFRGDTAQTLNPNYHEDLEFEANYGASELWLCGPEFRKRLPDFSIDNNSVKTLKEAFGATHTTTFWKFVVSQDVPVVGCISTPRWKWDATAGDHRCRHLMSSTLFQEQFPPLSKEAMLAIFEPKIAIRRGGPMGSFTVALSDHNGDMHEFRGETYFNTYDLLTMIVHVRKMNSMVSVG